MTTFSCHCTLTRLTGSWPFASGRGGVEISDPTGDTAYRDFHTRHRENLRAFRIRNLTKNCEVRIRSISVKTFGSLRDRHAPI